jgi:RimJ/RimL family protein N-acetyltransferase
MLDDAPAMFANWAQDPEVTRTMTWRPHENLDVTRSSLRRMIDAWEEETRFPYVIVEQSSNQAAGMVELRVEGHKAELGYVLARKHWNKGYMTEAARALLDWAFQQPQIYRVYATTSVANIGSQRVMEKLGMTREGLLRRYIIHPNVSDEPVDSYLYAIIK